MGNSGESVGYRQTPRLTIQRNPEFVGLLDSNRFVLFGRLTWDCPDLFHETEGIFYEPRFRYLSLFDSVDRLPFVIQLIATPRYSEKVALVCARHCISCNDRIPLCDQVVNFDV